MGKAKVTPGGGLQFTAGKVLRQKETVRFDGAWSLHGILVLIDMHFIHNNLERCQNKEKGEESSWNRLQRKMKGRKGCARKGEHAEQAEGQPRHAPLVTPDWCDPDSSAPQLVHQPSHHFIPNLHNQEPTFYTFLIRLLRRFPRHVLKRCTILRTWLYLDGAISSGWLIY